MFSNLVSTLTGHTNRLTQAQTQRRLAGLPVIDLITANPTQHGLGFPPDTLRAALNDAFPKTTHYQPDSKGQKIAREAIAAYEAQKGVVFDSENIILTPGTSQAYWYLFQLLAEPGDEILVPQPSYPLFDLIASLCHITLKPYPLAPTQRWALDTNACRDAITSKTRAIILISPHNPTGRVASARELAALAELANKHDLAIITDEVFSEFVFSTTAPLARAAATDAPLVFTLNGLSKMLALPGVKLGWISVSGKPNLVKTAVSALETIADTFLATHELIQFAAPALLERREEFLTTYRATVTRRAEQAHQLLADSSAYKFTPAQGGFYLALDVSQLTSDDDGLALDLLEKTGIFVHPGWFYDMPSPHLVLSFLSDEATLAAQLPRLRAFLETPPYLFDTRNS